MFYWRIHITLHIKWSCPLRISSVNVTNPQETADLVTFTEEILNVQLHFLCSVMNFLERGNTIFFWSTNSIERMIFAWYVWYLLDIPRLGKGSFSHTAFLVFSVWNITDLFAHDFLYNLFGLSVWPVSGSWPCYLKKWFWDILLICY